MWSLLMGNSYSSDEANNEERSEHNVVNSDTLKDSKDSSELDSKSSLDNRMNTNLLTSEASVRLGSFNQPLKITKIKSRKESDEEIASCDNERPSVHNKMHLVEKGEKYRIPSPTRERGDGMEDTESLSPNKRNEAIHQKQKIKISKPKKNSAEKLILLPQTGLAVIKLPPIIADKTVPLPSKTPTSPLIQMTLSQDKTCRQIQCRNVSTTNTTKKSKEPRFVPYEPYKAAVNPLVYQNSNRRQPKLERNNFKTVSEENKTEPDRNMKDEIINTQSSAASEFGDPDDNNVLSEVNNIESNETLALELENSKRLLAETTKKYEESEKQLQIQIQVNSEVKKLLVASVGEDIEAKVDYLTQDKARLAADIRQYSSKMSKDFEEKEVLSVESNLWKSKFLACSVIVDELARCKASLLHQRDDTNHHIRLLLHERQVLFGLMSKNQEVLLRLKNAFDPLSISKPKDLDSNTINSLNEVEKISLLGLAELNLNTGNVLNERLLGSKECIPKGITEKSKYMEDNNKQQLDTPAEEGLRQIMSEITDSSTQEDYSTRASVAVTGTARPHLAKMNDKLSAPTLKDGQFKSCTHCQGSVYTV